MITAGTGYAKVVKPDEIRTPLPSLNMGQHWGISGHLYNVGIAFKRGHESSLVDTCPCVIILLSVVMASIFSGKHLGALAVIVVIAVHIVEEPVHGSVEMFVHQIGLQLRHLLPTVFKVLPVGTRPAGTHDADVRVCLSDTLHKEFQPLKIETSPLLVAHCNVFQTKRFGMPHLRSELSPLRRAVPVGKFN